MEDDTDLLRASVCKSQVNIYFLKMHKDVYA